MEQGGLGSGVGVGVVVFLVFAVVLAAGAGADDPSVFVASDVTLALSAGVGAGGELLDESFIMTAQASEDGDEGAVAGGGDHAGRVFAGREEDPAR